MTAKGSHPKSGKTGTPPHRVAERASGTQRKAASPSPRGAARHEAPERAAKSKEGKPRGGPGPLTAMFTTPTPIDSIDALTGPDPIVNDDQTTADEERSAAGASSPRRESKDERKARARKKAR